MNFMEHYVACMKMVRYLRLCHDNFQTVNENKTKPENISKRCILQLPVMYYGFGVSEIY